MHVWYQLLDARERSLEVVAVARDYLATWTPEELALLPVAVRPGTLRDEQDVEDLHATLVEEYRGTKATGEALERAAAPHDLHGARAAIRIAELRAKRALRRPNRLRLGEAGGEEVPRSSALRLAGDASAAVSRSTQRPPSFIQTWKGRSTSANTCFSVMGRL